MTKKYSKHYLLDENSVVDYVFNRIEYFDKKEDIRAKEIGDGNINYVFRLFDGDKSLVVKQADKLLRSSQRPLDRYRNTIEAQALEIQNTLVSDFVPKLYDFNEDMSTIIMEDISAYKNMRKEIFEGRVFEDFSDLISTYLVDSLLPTSDLVMDRAKKKDLEGEFINIEMCDISEDLVFTEPYFNYKNRNRFNPKIKNRLEDMLYKDKNLHKEIAYLRSNFINNRQALIHGDLHTGSIFINDRGIKIIDPEFAFFGPMGYDIGNVIGNLYFAYAYKLFNPNKEFITWIKKTIAEILENFVEKFRKSFDQKVKLPIYNHLFRDQYLEKLKSDSLGYAGTEIIRRTVGDSKVLEVESMEDSSYREDFEMLLVDFAKSMIMKRYKIKTPKDLSYLFEEKRLKYVDNN